MRRTVLLSAVLFLASTTAALATPIIDVGDHLFSPGEIRTIAISVTGGDEVAGLNFCIQIGDGGEANFGVDTLPIMTAVDIVSPGTIFNASNFLGQSDTASPLMWLAQSVTDDTIAPTLSCTGILAYVTIDTTGAVPGETFPLLLKGVALGSFGEPGLDTYFSDVFGVDVLADITNGSITIIPEPSTIGLLCSMLVAISVTALRRRRS